MPLFKSQFFIVLPIVLPIELPLVLPIELLIGLFHRFRPSVFRPRARLRLRLSSSAE